MRSPKMPLALALLVCAGGVGSAGAADSWPMRSLDLRNTGNAGHDAQVQTWMVKHLTALDTIETEGAVNGTPVVSAEGLLVTGDTAGYVYVIDTGTGTRLLRIDTGSGGDEIADPLGRPLPVGVTSTPFLATVTVPGGAEERRAYVAVSDRDQTLHCIDLERVLADRASLADHPGDGYFCNGPAQEDGSPAWPRSLAVSDSEVMRGVPVFSRDQTIDVDGASVIRDVIYAPTTGDGCANAEFQAIDAYSGAIYWRFDPVPDGDGGAIGTTPAMNAERTVVYLTTGACPGGVQFGDYSGSLVALDAATGEVVWHHQRRILDPTGFGIGTGPLVADVTDVFDGHCRVVVSSGGDGCIYGFEQTPDTAEPGEPGFDPLRSGQQRILYRKCFVPCAPDGGGFDASNLAFDGYRMAAQQTSGFPVPHAGADNSNGFAIDVCSGRVEWASAVISNGRADGAIANGMLFQLGRTRSSDGVAPTPPETVQELQVVLMYSDFRRVPDVLATVELPHPPTLGGGGPAIVKGRVYVPTSGGIVVVGVDPGSNASPPQTLPEEMNVFAGPYLYPVAPATGAPAAFDAAGFIENPFEPGHPLPLIVDKCIEENGTYRSDRQVCAGS